MLNAKNSLQFGIFEKTSVSIGSGSISSSFSVNSREYMTATTKELVKFETKEIKKRLKYQFLAAIRIPNTEFVIGVTTVSSELVVLQLSDIYRPVLEHFKTGQPGIFHLLYSPKSQTLITIGTGVRTWKLRYRISDKFTSLVRSEVTITPRAQFATFYETSILSCPALDTDQELIFLPEDTGVFAYDFDGERVRQATCVPASVSTCCCYNTETRKLMTYDTSEGMCLWSPSGKRVKQFTVPNASILAMYFVDHENVVCYNAKQNFYFLNIKTERTFQCFETDEKPNRMTIVRDRPNPELIFSFGMRLKVVRLVIPWLVWRLNIPCAPKMERCNKFCEAGRVVVQTATAYIQLFSPVNGRMLTMATPSEPVRPVDYFYDRGIVIYHRRSKTIIGYEPEVVQIHPGQKRDEILLALQDGTFCGFQTGVSPCEEIFSVKAKARYLTFVKYNGNWCYAYSSDHGDIYIVDYESFEVLKHSIVSSDKLLGVMYHNETEHLLMFFEGLVLLYDIDSERVLYSLKMKTPCSKGLFGDFIKFGYETGHIAHIEIEKEALVIDDPECLRRPHNDAVTGFSFSPEVWISSSMDGVILVWDYNDFNIHKIILPLPLYSCLLLNGRRDILVATETEIMKINGSTIFDRDFDDERTEIDNFDRIRDALNTEMPDSQEEEEESDEDSLEEYIARLSRRSEARRNSVDQRENDVKSFVEAMKKMPMAKTLGPPPPLQKTEEQEKTDREQERRKILEEMKRINESESIAPPAPRTDYLKKETEPVEVKKKENSGDKEVKPKTPVTVHQDSAPRRTPKDTGEKQVENTPRRKKTKKHKKAPETHRDTEEDHVKVEKENHDTPIEKPITAIPTNTSEPKDTEPPKYDNKDPEKQEENTPKEKDDNGDKEPKIHRETKTPKSTKPVKQNKGRGLVTTEKKIKKVTTPRKSKKRTKMKDFSMSLNHAPPIADARVHTDLNFQIGEPWHGEIKHLAPIRDIRRRAQSVRTKRWGYVKVRGLNWKRARTPPRPRKFKRPFVIPAPHIILDYEAIMEMIRQGHTEYEALLTSGNVLTHTSKWERYASVYSHSPRARMAQTYHTLSLPLGPPQAIQTRSGPIPPIRKSRKSDEIFHSSEPFSLPICEDDSDVDEPQEQREVRQVQSEVHIPRLHELSYGTPTVLKPKKERMRRVLSMSTGGLKFDMTYLEYCIEREKEAQKMRPSTSVPPLEMPELEPQEEVVHPVHEPEPRQSGQSSRRCDRGTQPETKVRMPTSGESKEDPLEAAVMAKLPSVSVRRECASVRKSRRVPLVKSRFKNAVPQPKTSESAEFGGSLGVRCFSSRSNRFM